LRCVVVGEDEREDEELGGVAGRWEYDEFDGVAGEEKQKEKQKEKEKEKGDGGKKSWDGLMPMSASVSFQVKGWLASGLKVDKLVVDTARSRGLGPGVSPYKGVKYMTASQDGVEIRC